MPTVRSRCCAWGPLPFFHSRPPFSFHTLPRLTRLPPIACPPTARSWTLIWPTFSTRSGASCFRPFMGLTGKSCGITPTFGEDKTAQRRSRLANDEPSMDVSCVVLQPLSLPALQGSAACCRSFRHDLALRTVSGENARRRLCAILWSACARHLFNACLRLPHVCIDLRP